MSMRLTVDHYDHTSFREDAPDKNPPLIISDSAMDNFLRLTSIKNPHVIPVTSENIKYKLGDEVVITEGEFKGIHGRVTRIAGQQRVVVELFGGNGVCAESGNHYEKRHKIKEIAKKVAKNLFFSFFFRTIAIECLLICTSCETLTSKFN